MNVYQVSGNEIRYETAKSTSGTKSAKGENDFRDILKNKSGKVHGNQGKTTRGKKTEDEKVKDNDLLTPNKNVPEDKVSENMEETHNVTVINLFGSEFLSSDAPETDSKTEPAQNIPVIVPAGNSDHSSVSRNFTAAQESVTLDAVSLGLNSFKGETASGEKVQVNKNETDGKTGQDLLNTADVKKESSVAAADYKSTQTNEKGSEKVSQKSNLSAESDSADETSNNGNVLDAAVVGAKEDFIHIKVAEPYTEKSWEAAAKEIDQAVVESIKDNKVEKLNISLNPKELGEIKVEFVIEQDKISVSLICSNEKTKSLLLENTDTLSKIIQSNLRQDTEVTVSYSEKNSHQENGSENYDGRGNNSHYKEDSQHSGRQDKDSDHDFLQKLRLGILDFERIEV